MLTGGGRGLVASIGGLSPDSNDGVLQGGRGDAGGVRGDDERIGYAGWQREHKGLLRTFSRPSRRSHLRKAHRIRGTVQLCTNHIYSTVQKQFRAFQQQQQHIQRLPVNVPVRLFEKELQGDRSRHVYTHGIASAVCREVVCVRCTVGGATSMCAGFTDVCSYLLCTNSFCCSSYLSLRS